MLHWTIQLLGKPNPTIVAFLVLRYVRNDNTLHFHISLVYAKKRWLHISSRPGEDNGYSDIEAKALELWASPHMDVGFCNKIVAYQEFLAGYRWANSRNHDDDEDKRKRQNKKRCRDKRWTCKTAKQNTHGNCTTHLFADSFVIKARRTLSDLIGMAIRSTKCPWRGSAVCERY